MSRPPAASHLAVVAILATGLLSPSTALAITDGSFESGFGTWQVFGDVLLDDTSVTQQFGTAATDGNVQLFLSNLPNGFPTAGAPLGGAGPFSGTNALTAAALETSLGLNAGQLDALSPSGNPATQGSGVWQEFSATAGAMLSFDWNFLTNEPTPTATYTDFFFWVLTPLGGGAPVQGGVLMDTSQGAQFGASPAPQLNEETGYQSFSTAIAAAGDYRLVLGVLDVNDQNFTSAVMLDNFALVPEASTGLLILIGLLGLVAAGRRRVPRDRDLG